MEKTLTATGKRLFQYRQTQLPKPTSIWLVVGANFPPCTLKQTFLLPRLNQCTVVKLAHFSQPIWKHFQECQHYVKFKGLIRVNKPFLLPFFLWIYMLKPIKCKCALFAWEKSNDMVRQQVKFLSSHHCWIQLTLVYSSLGCLATQTLLLLGNTKHWQQPTGLTIPTSIKHTIQVHQNYQYGKWRSKQTLTVHTSSHSTMLFFY